MLSLTTMFLLGNWVFIVMNLFLIKLDIVPDWAVYITNNNNSMYKTSIIICIGLVFFSIGSMQATTKNTLKKERVPLMPLSAKQIKILLFLGIFFSIISLYSSFYINQQVESSGFEGRTAIFVNLAYLSTTACALFAIIFFCDRYIRLGSKIILIVIMSYIIYHMMTSWSRRPLIVFFMSLLGWFVYKRKLSMVYLYSVFPIMLFFSIGLLYYRIFLYYSVQIDWLDFSSLIEQYVKEKLWMETSAFSCMMYVVDHIENTKYLYGSSFVSGLIFWIPRILFPTKPIGFEISEQLNITSSMPVSLYGEIMINFSVYSIPFVMYFIGFIFKRIDIYMMVKNNDPVVFMLYCIAVFNTLFLARGSFNTIVVPIQIQAIMPYFLYYFLMKKIKW